MTLVAWFEATGVWVLGTMAIETTHCYVRLMQSDDAWLALAGWFMLGVQLGIAVFLWERLCRDKDAFIFPGCRDYATAYALTFVVLQLLGATVVGLATAAVMGYPPGFPWAWLYGGLGATCTALAAASACCRRVPAASEAAFSTRGAAPVIDGEQDEHVASA
jgi:hypothetical protein